MPLVAGRPGPDGHGIEDDCSGVPCTDGGPGGLWTTC